MPEPLFIGIDGGGTNCRARIADAAGRTLGEGMGGPANVRLDPARAMQSILAATREAAARAGIAEKDIRGAHAGFGLAGAAVKSACDRLRKLLGNEGFFGALEIRTDAYATWLGAFGGGPGAIFIVGTGSCGLAVVNGEDRYVGGYGAEISDEASSVWMGREAVRRSLWAHDKRAAMTPLAQAILSRFDDDPAKIIAFAADAAEVPGKYGDFSETIFSHAQKGDPLATSLVSEAAAAAEGIITQLLNLGAPSVYLHGGVAKPLSAWLPPHLQPHIVKRINDKGVPLEGAILMARRAAERT
jgi:glucosamine kinase